MKKFIPPYLLFTILSITTLFSQKVDYSSSLIPIELKENANAVVRDCQINITIEDVDEMVIYKREVVTVLNKLGNKLANLSEFYNDDTKINKLSVRIYDANGKQIKKINKNKFLDVSAIDGETLYSDSRVKYVNYTPISYPYTVVFESEKVNSSTGFVPRWLPLKGFFVGVEKSKYEVVNPKNIPFKVKEENFKDFRIKNIGDEKNVHFVLEQQKPLKPELYTLAINEIFPQLTVGFERFTIKEIEGEATNWKELGQWEYNVLYKDEDNISENTKQKILKLVEGINDPIEKAKIVYKFVQEKTRYINVSIGIGGLRPMRSEDVDKLGYGDCKGLTNYTRALLKIVGIESYFTELFAGSTKLNMDYDFPVIHGNHVILNIPNNGKDIWLECTNQIMPFGFLGDFTDDRDVLVIKPEGAIKKRTPRYLNQDNTQTLKATIYLDEEGNVISDLIRESKGIQYDNRYFYHTFSEDELYKWYKSKVWSYNNNLDIKSSKLFNDKEKIVFTENLKIQVKNYATLNGNEYLFRVNIFNRESFVPKRYRNRKFPLKVSRGYMDIDEYLVNIPGDYVLGVLPSEKNIETKFGFYKVTFTKINDTSFKYKKTILIKDGIYPKEDYKAYRRFRKSIAKYDNLRIAITKKS